MQLIEVIGPTSCALYQRNINTKGGKAGNQLQGRQEMASQPLKISFLNGTFCHLCILQVSRKGENFTAAKNRGHDMVA